MRLLCKYNSENLVKIGAFSVGTPFEFYIGQKENSQPFRRIYYEIYKPENWISCKPDGRLYYQDFIPL